MAPASRVLLGWKRASKNRSRPAAHEKSVRYGLENTFRLVEFEWVSCRKVVAWKRILAVPWPLRVAVLPEEQECPVSQEYSATVLAVRQHERIDLYLHLQPIN